MMQWRTHQHSSGSPLLSGQSVRYRPRKAMISLIFLVTVKRSAFWHDWIYTPSPMSPKASSSIADRNIEKSVGDSMHPCLTPFIIENVI